MKTACVTKTKSKKLKGAYKTPGGKVGGISKAPKTAIPKAKYGISMKKGDPVIPVPGMKKSQAKAEEFYDKNPSVRTYTNEYTGKTIPTGPMTKQEYQEAAQRAADVYDDKPTPMRKKGGAMNSTKKTTYKSGGATKPKMMNGGAKPKAMYGASMKPGMMKKGGVKKS